MRLSGRMLPREMRTDVMPGAFNASSPANHSVEAAEVPTPPTQEVLPKALPVALVHESREKSLQSSRSWLRARSLGQASSMKSRVHPKYKTKYRVSNWADYDRALVQRGNITLWISEEAIERWNPTPSGKRGGQRKFSDHAIETALTLRLVFKLPLRQAEGFLRSILSLMGVGLEAPEHTTLSRRSRNSMSVSVTPLRAGPFISP